LAKSVTVEWGERNGSWSDSFGWTR
jgi:hypothetical protein